MTCWHCEKELDFCYQTADFITKVYHCADCERWYELRKEKPKLNAAVPVRFLEIETPYNEALSKAA